MNRTPIALAAAAFAFTTIATADARSFMSRGQKGMRVSASFQTIVPITGQVSVEEQAKATESARRSLYDIASRECGVITKVFKGTCKISNLNVRSYVQNRGNGLQQIQVSASATYMVTPNRDDEEDRGQDGKKL